MIHTDLVLNGFLKFLIDCVSMPILVQRRESWNFLGSVVWATIPSVQHLFKDCRCPILPTSIKTVKPILVSVRGA
mgnify:FL=1